MTHNVRMFGAVAGVSLLRPPVAALVADADAQQPSAAERAAIERLRALRNDRPLQLLE